MPRLAPLLSAALIFALPALAEEEKKATLFKTPWCGCCKGYVQHMRDQGWQVETRDLKNLDMVKRIMGVPIEMQSCHTITIGDYVVEGHVPLAYIDKLMTEKPKIRGIALPGMPTGTPGMPGPREPLTIMTLESPPKVYATRP